MATDLRLSNFERFSFQRGEEKDELRDGSLVKVWISATSTIDKKVSYTISIKSMANQQSWQVNRRYSHFLNLRNSLVSHFTHSITKCPGCVMFQTALKKFEFPKKHAFTSKSNAVIRYRVLALRKFIQLVVSRTLSTSPKCSTCGGAVFDLVKLFLLKDATPLQDSNLDSIRDSITLKKTQRDSEVASRPSAYVSEPSTASSSSKVSQLRKESVEMEDVTSSSSLKRSRQSAKGASGEQNAFEKQKSYGVENIDFALTRKTKVVAPIDLHNVWEPWEMMVQDK